MGDHLSDGSPLISAASSGKLRLVRLLVEGGAQVNRRNPRGETPLLAACKALRGAPAGPETEKLLTYLLQNKADPNAQDEAGRTALMYACMERAGAQVASALLAAGADPGMEDQSGASALVYAINAQHQPTLKLLMDACQARGSDIIIITTEMGVDGGPVTRHYLNVAPSPDTSPVSCMSPSDIVLKTGSPNSPKGENIFNFRGTTIRENSSSHSRLPSGAPGPLSQCSTLPTRQRLCSEPWLTIHNLACLNQVHKEAMSKRSPPQEGRGEDSMKERGRREDKAGEYEETHFHQFRLEKKTECEAQRGEHRFGRENYNSCSDGFLPGLSQSLLSVTETSWSHSNSTSLVPRRCLTPGYTTLDKMTPKCDKLSPSPHSHLRRNTLPSVTLTPPLLLVDQSDAHLQVPTQILPSKSRSFGFLPHPPSSSPPRASVRPALLPLLPLTSSVTSLMAPPASCCSERSRRLLRRHSVQLEEIGGGPI